MTPEEKAKLSALVTAWLKHQDFDQGIALLGTYRPPMARIFAGRKTYASKLKYELCKLAGIDHTNLTSKESKATDNSDKGKKDGIIPNPVKGNSKPGELPEIMDRVIKEHSRLVMLRSQLGEQRLKLPDTNEEETVKARKNLSDAIAEASSRIELLFDAQNQFYKNHILPVEENLFPQPAGDELPTDASKLKLLKKNLQTANTKDHNLLDYQQEKKGKSFSKMPEGPKRQAIEMRMEERLQKIEEINYALNACKK